MTINKPLANLFYYLFILFLLAGLASSHSFAESNPFDNQGSSNSEDTELMDELDEEDMPAEAPNFGFAPPKQVEAQEPMRPAPKNQVTRPPMPKTTPTPPPSTTTRNVAKPLPTRPVPPQRTQPRLPQPSTTAKKSDSTKLTDYLALDPSVKSLEVKNFDIIDRDIKDVITLISKWTGKNFILDRKVTQAGKKVTILGPSQVTLQEAYQAFLSALAANGLTTIQNGKFIRVIESAEARRSPVKTYTGAYAPVDDNYITRIYQLKYINADEVQREFRDMTSRQGKLFAYEPTNSIIITDTGTNIQRIIDILETLDVKTHETSLHVLEIEHGSAKGIANMLQDIYGDTKSSSRSRRSFRKSALERTRGGGIISKIIPDEQTNSLVVLANHAGFQQLKLLVAKLDIKTSDSGKIRVYYCQYAKAEDLAQTLAALSTGSPSSSSRRRTSTSRSKASKRTSRANTSGRTVTAELEGGIKVTADAPTNALVIIASASDYNTLERVIKKLDIPRLQVFIETAILDMAADDSTKIGVNLGFESNDKIFGGGFAGDSKTLTTIATNGVPEGLTIPMRGTIGNLAKHGIRGFAALVNFLTSNTRSSVLSTPQIIALDNEEAEFKVQDSIPVVSSFSPGTTGGTLPTTNVERQKVGIAMKITPNINAASRTIRLTIAQKVDSIREAASVPEQLRAYQVATTTRETNTSVVVRDRDYVMLGGLMSDKIEITETKVPLLGDIPILGWLFKSRSVKPTKRNLVILLRPQIISTSGESAQLISQKLEKRKQFIRDNMDDNDYHKRAVDEILQDIGEQAMRGNREATAPTNTRIDVIPSAKGKPALSPTAQPKEEMEEDLLPIEEEEKQKPEAAQKKPDTDPNERLLPVEDLEKALESTDNAELLPLPEDMRESAEGDVQ